MREGPTSSVLAGRLDKYSLESLMTPSYPCGQANEDSTCLVLPSSCRKGGSNKPECLRWIVHELMDRHGESA